ncbi:unnamed protein product [Phytomonas sp. Hart1]|nr:unnamed protein product [Phytomonas sp. Hart1]|eukprot:CCW71320.1 unnamed protein product [Phytomonas sp. isolate Hart1]
MTSITHTTEQMLTTSHESPPVCLNNCLLVYPIPSIADESFLGAIFRSRVRRSVFSGFGRHRFAIVELDDVERAEKVYAWASHRLVEEKSSGTQSTDEPTLPLLNGDEDCTLAEIAEAVAHEQAAKSNDTADLDYLSNLRWSGKYRIYVVPSPFAIQELFDCGGTVPQNKSFNKRVPPNVNKRDIQSKHQPEREAALPPDDVPTPRRTRTEGDESPGKTTFPKDCCQKCGSSAHFTRHCDGSGPLPSAKTEVQAKSPSREDVEVVIERKPSTCEETKDYHPPSTNFIDGADAASVCKKPTFTRTSKDQCKHCGSDEHLSRHCPNK